MLIEVKNANKVFQNVDPVEIFNLEFFVGKAGQFYERMISFPNFNFGTCRALTRSALVWKCSFVNSRTGLFIALKRRTNLSVVTNIVTQHAHLA